MGYHIKLYSADKDKFESFDFDMNRLKKDEDDDCWDLFNKEFSEIFKYEFEIGNFLNYKNLLKIESDYGDIYKIEEDELLDIIIQYKENQFKYYSEFVDSLEKKLHDDLTKSEENALIVDLYNHFNTKKWEFTNWDNNVCIDKNTARLTNNWNFEADVIDIIRIYKTTDFTKKVLICVGS
jgi:hypothetical protein